MSNIVQECTFCTIATEHNYFVNTNSGTRQTRSASRHRVAPDATLESQSLYVLYPGMSLGECHGTHVKFSLTLTY